VTAFGFPFGITVTVQRQTEDRFGNFTTASEQQVGPCAIDYTSSTEPIQVPSDTVAQVATLYAPAGSDVRPQDRVVLPGGTRWSVIGFPADFTNPFTGWNPGLTVRLQQVSG
jgi:hypothetical protein